jgi:hypothetical protein
LFKDWGIAHTKTGQKFGLIAIKRRLQSDCRHTLRGVRQRRIETFAVQLIGLAPIKGNGLRGDHQIVAQNFAHFGQQIAQVVARLLVIAFTPKEISQVIPVLGSPGDGEIEKEGDGFAAQARHWLSVKHDLGGAKTFQIQQFQTQARYYTGHRSYFHTLDCTPAKPYHAAQRWLCRGGILSTSTRRRQ